MSPFAPTTAEALRAALASTLACGAQELQEAVGQVVVATAAELPQAATAGSGVRSVHDAATRTTVLLADRIPAGQEAQALAQEIERHHGRQAAQAVLGERADALLGGESGMSNYVERPSLAKEDVQSHERAVAQWMDYMARKVPCVIYPGGTDAQNKFIVAPAEAPNWWLGDYALQEGAEKFCSNNGLSYEIHEVKPRACTRKPADESPSLGM